jgi:hypothetical protein
MTLTEACTTICDVAAGPSGLTCAGDKIDSTACPTDCSNYDTTLNDYYLAMMRCVAQELTSVSDFVCSQGAWNLWSPVGQTACEDAICEWNCREGYYNDYLTFVRCADEGYDACQ